jgi:hypothetical protein
VKTCHAKRATVADPLAQQLPSIAQIIAIVPRDPRHVAKVFGLGLANAKWDD